MTRPQHSHDRPPSPLLQVVVGFALAVVMIVTVATLAMFGIHMNGYGWIGIFLVLWTGVFISIRWKLKFFLISFGLTVIVGWAVLRSVLSLAR
jgi:hypothetical protein